MLIEYLKSVTISSSEMQFKEVDLYKNKSKSRTLDPHCLNYNFERDNSKINKSISYYQ